MKEATIVSIVGYVSGTLTTFAGVPQVFHIIKTKSTKDISYLYLLMSLSGLCMWNVYAHLTHSMPMIVWNSISIFICGTMFTIKIGLEKGESLSTFRKNITNALRSTPYSALEIDDDKC